MLGVLAVLAVAVDFIASAFGVKRFGASGRAVTGATIGAIVGLFFGIVGVLVGPFVGAVVGELSVRRNLAAAGRAGVGAALGLALGTAAKLAIAFAMIGVIVVMRLALAAPASAIRILPALNRRFGRPHQGAIGSFTHSFRRPSNGHSSARSVRDLARLAAGDGQRHGQRLVR